MPKGTLSKKGGKREPAKDNCYKFDMEEKTLINVSINNKLKDINNDEQTSSILKSIRNEKSCFDKEEISTIVKSIEETSKEGFFRSEDAITRLKQKLESQMKKLDELE